MHRQKGISSIANGRVGSRRAVGSIIRLPTIGEAVIGLVSASRLPLVEVEACFFSHIQSFSLACSSVWRVLTAR
jgi:hypothetical protein